MTTDVEPAELPAPPCSPQPPKAVKTAKEDAASALKLLANRRKRRDRSEKRSRESAASQAERQLRLKQAREDLAAALVDEPLVISSSAITADLDEIEPESEFNCFVCQFEPSRSDSERRINAWIGTPEASAAVPDLVAFLRDSPDALDGFLFVSEYHDLPLKDDIVPAALCKIIFELTVFGDSVTSDAAWSLLTYLIQNPVDIKFEDGHSADSQNKSCVRRGIACGLEWCPPDAFFIEAWQALGYVPPRALAPGSSDGNAMVDITTGRGTCIKVIDEQSTSGAAKVFCKPAALSRPRRHPWSRRVKRLCALITLLEKSYHSQHPGADPAVPPPFGDDPALAAMLCRTAADAALPTVRCAAAAAVASYLSMHAPGDDRAWGRRFAAMVPDLRTELPSSQALVRVCRAVSGNARCDMVRQALAMASLEAQHGGEDKLEVTDVASVPVLAVIQKLPDWREMLKTMTPPGDAVPFGWEVLSTAEFIHMLVEPAIAAQLVTARVGSCPTDTITRTIIPLLDGLAKGLKNRRTVSVFRTRLLCSSMCGYFSEVHTTLRAVAQAKMHGQGPISLASQ